MRMIQSLLGFILVSSISFLAFAAPPSVVPQADTADVTLVDKEAHDFFDLLVKTGDGQLVPLTPYRGQVVMVVNTASRCGHTPQYEALQKLYTKYKDKGFVVLGFPSNDFGGQEPGTDKEIKDFCTLNYRVDFPIFKKSPVSGTDKQPVYRFLTERGPKELQGEVKWNFEKFLVNRKGEPVARFLSAVKPESPEVIAKIEALLKEPVPQASKPASKKK